MPTDESVWRRDGVRHATIDVGPNVGVLATTDQEYQLTNRLVKSTF